MRLLKVFPLPYEPGDLFDSAQCREHRCATLRGQRGEAATIEFAVAALSVKDSSICRNRLAAEDHLSGRKYRPSVSTGTPSLSQRMVNI